MTPGPSPRSERSAAPIAAGLLPDDVPQSAPIVLLVDLARDEVQFMNAPGRALAPEVVLPISIDDWARLAGLQDLSGRPLASSGDEHRGGPRPSGMAAGDLVFGEAVTAGRIGGAGPREPLWVLGMPITGAPSHMSSLALVALLPLRYRAVLATRMSFSISDPHAPDNPLVWVSPAFTLNTGYSFDEAVGRNCRFLQGLSTEEPAVAKIRAGVASETPVTTRLLNYRKDGSTFWNQLSVSPLLDRSGEISHFVGVQYDVSDQVRSEQTRAATLIRAETAGERLTMLSSFTREITGTLDPAGVIDLFANFVVPRLATWCALYTLDDDTGQLSTPTVLHERGTHDDAIGRAVERMRELAPAKLRKDGPIWQVLNGDVPHVLIDSPPRTEQAVLGSDDELAGLAPVLGLSSMIVVPLTARDRIIGAFGIAADDDRRPYTSEDLALVLDLAARVGLMIENATLYARQRDASAILQRGLLPELPQVAGIQLCADYVPAMSQAEVGGDWYDVFPLADGRVGIAIGDVMGHDFTAATTMGSLRYVLRSYAWPGCAPDQVLNQVDELIHGMSLGLLATCIYGRLTLRSADTPVAAFEYANAGHPPPLLVHPDGRTEALSSAHGVMIGVQNVGGEREPRSCTSVPVPSGGKIVCFTDGLVEADGSEYDEALERVRASIEELGAGSTCSGIVEHLVRRARDSVRPDDVAVLVVGVD